MPEYLNWALTGFTSLAWWVIYVCALNWKERNTASKSAKDVVDTRSTIGYQSLPWHYCCRTHEWYSHYTVLPLALPSLKTVNGGAAQPPSLQNWGQMASLQGQPWSFPSHLMPATLCSCACICPQCWSVLCFQEKCLYQRQVRAFGNICSWAQERQRANDLCEVEAMFFLA